MAEKKPKNIHAGHRARMRERVRRYGLESLAPHEVLEYLLYYPIPKKDTNPIAHALLERFGSLAGVLEASEEALCEVEEVGPVTAQYLHMLPELCSYYFQAKEGGAPRMAGTDRLGEYLVRRFAGVQDEQVLLVSLGRRQQIRSAVWLKTEGNAGRVRLDIKNAVETALRGGTDRVVVCHNHPNGAAFPSKEDLQATASLVRALGLIQVQLVDHIIVTHADYYSLREHDQLPLYDPATGTLVWPGRPQAT